MQESENDNIILLLCCNNHCTTELARRSVQTRLAGLSRDDHFRYETKLRIHFDWLFNQVLKHVYHCFLYCTMLWSKFVLGCMTQIILP